MNLKSIYQIIENYKTNFANISQDEIYKWKAVKCFQTNWNIDAENLTEMLTKSLKQANNLLASNNYFPKRMLMYISKVSPEALRNLFIKLFDEEIDLVDRIRTFEKGVQVIQQSYFDDKNHFQDKRAIMVYLTMKYPDRYYFYKFSMFKKFASTVGYSYMPKKGLDANIPQYISFCNILKEIIIEDNQLLRMLSSHLKYDEYPDTSYNILTQDILYSLTRLGPISIARKLTPIIKKIDNIHLLPKHSSVNLKGAFLNYENIAKENKKIGLLGEILVFEYEEAKLAARKSKMKPKHISREEGDGLGYDILSYDDYDQPVYIEVKTTTGSHKNPFFITKNELECSIRNLNSYRLYRIYDFKPETKTANLIQYQGSLLNLCVNPILFEV